MNRITGSILWRSVAMTLLGLLACESSANAGWFWKGARRKESCNEPESCVTPPVAPPQAPPTLPPVTPQAPAVFQAPQATSDISGPSESIGIRGFGIRVPECNLQLPTIQLPSIVRYRRGSEANFESARVPQLAGMAAMPSQLVPGGPNIPVAPTAPPVAPAAPPALPPAMPPTAPNCVPQAPGASISSSDQQTVNELLETRRALEAYRQELTELRRVLGSIQTATDEPGAPPSPAVQRLSYPQRAGSETENRRRLEPKVVEAGYAEDEEIVPRRTVTLKNRRITPAEENSTRMPAENSQPGRATTRATTPAKSSVGHSEMSNDENSGPAGLGTWARSARNGDR